MKKLSNKILVIGLVVLIGAFAASRLFRSPGMESNLRGELLNVDTVGVNEIRILPAREHTGELKLSKKDNSWIVGKGERTEPASKATVKGVLSSLVNMKAQRMASRKKEKWEEYNVGENSTHVTIYRDGDIVADFHVGKLGFVQNAGGQFGGAYTYVRLSDEDEVYVVEGFLESSFNMGFNDWRDKTFLKLNRNEITKISFHYPADSGFVVDKRDSVWYMADQKIDRYKMEGVLDQFGTKFFTEFADGFTPGSPAQVSIQVDGKLGPLTTIEAWRKDDTEWVCTSSLQKGIYFSSKGSTVVADFFIGRKKLLPEPIR